MITRSKKTVMFFVGYTEFCIRCKHKIC